MKKFALFFTFFLFFGFLSAEEAQKDASENAEAALKTAKEDCDCDVSRETPAEKPKFFYIQPAWGFGTGASGYRVTAALDAGFLVGSTEVANFYVGLDFDFRAGMVALLLKDSKEFAIQVNGVFDFAVANPELKNVDLWISLGFDLIYGGKYHEEDFQDPSFYYVQAWGIGLDFVFTNNIILKAGIDGFLGIIPDLTLLVGYRF